MKKILIVGHRGAPSRAVENTEESFRAALEDGADIIETDVRLTADRHLVVSHDESFRRLGGPDRLISRCSRRELEGLTLRDSKFRSAKALFMDQALEHFPKTHFCVDLKDPGQNIIKAWDALLTAYDAAGRCRTASFRDRTLRQFHRLRPKAGLSVARFGVLTLLAQTAMGRPRAPKQEVLQIPERSGTLRVLTPKRLAAWQNRGWEVQVWTVDHEEDMKRLLRWGVDGIITNNPALLKSLIQGQAEK